MPPAVILADDVPVLVVVGLRRRAASDLAHPLAYRIVGIGCRQRAGQGQRLVPVAARAIPDIQYSGQTGDTVIISVRSPLKGSPEGVQKGNGHGRTNDVHGLETRSSGGRKGQTECWFQFWVVVEKQGE